MIVTTFVQLSKYSGQLTNNVETVIIVSDKNIYSSEIRELYMFPCCKSFTIIAPEGSSMIIEKLILPVCKNFSVKNVTIDELVFRSDVDNFVSDKSEIDIIKHKFIENFVMYDCSFPKMKEKRITNSLELSNVELRNDFVPEHVKQARFEDCRNSFINIVFKELLSLKLKCCAFGNVFFIKARKFKVKKCRIGTLYFDTVYDKFNVDNESEISNVFGDRQNRCGKGSECNSNLIKLIG